jgi:glycosyltransferase involved in cell wall biosynthesis
VANSVLFTVFTPTYNRAHTLHRVYDSLCAQTLRDFEWIVIDDGSTDGTAELVANWAKSADFPVRYLCQDHSGKHIAHNLAVREARGCIFAPLDSDDALLPETFERIRNIWNDIPVSDRVFFSGIGGLCCDQHGKTIGDRFPKSPLDITMRELIYGLGIRGEKWGVTRTDVLRQYFFPDVAGTQFVPEGLVGLQMSRAYKRRYVNEVFRIYYRFEYEKPGNNLSNRADIAANAPGRLCYYLWLLNKELEYFWRAPVSFVKAAVLLPILGKSSNQTFGQLLGSVESVAIRMLVLVLFPVGLVIYAFSQIRRSLSKDTRANHSQRISPDA